MGTPALPLYRRRSALRTCTISNLYISVEHAHYLQLVSEALELSLERVHLVVQEGDLVADAAQPGIQDVEPSARGSKPMQASHSVFM